MENNYLRAEHLQKKYREKCVVSDINLEIRSGEIVGLLGPNGAGKTTSFYMIVGLVRADGGRVLLNGKDITRLPIQERASLGVGYLPQETSIFKTMTVEDNIYSILEITRKDKKERIKKLRSLLEEFSIKHLRKSAASTLSGGERRRVEIVRVLAAEPSFILLDEPFAGIDPLAVGDIMNTIKKLKNRGLGILITDHNARETLSIVDRAYIVCEGKILTEGNRDEILNDDGVRKFYLGMDFK
ncbi:MAG: LPS export ABC transporter ATP-binding protein [Rickettsiales bacterium]|jgi:lipopolysaccharide export system ATP-binding protein|nr:LPS export ABC transporter ATP-binding protein [Rickettsiales bacterium]